MDQRISLVSDIVTHQNGNNLLTQVGSQLGCLGDQLIADLLDGAVALFNNNKDILIHCLISLP